MSYKTDKKENARYWDKIDSTIEQLIINIANFSDTKIEKDTVDDIICEGIVADVREIIIARFTEKGGYFPFVNEDM